jgi:phenylacetate-CoA ligase
VSKSKSPSRRPGRKKGIRLEKGQRRRLRAGGSQRCIVPPRSALPGIGWPALPAPSDAAVLALNYQFEQSQWWPRRAIEAMQLRQAEQLLAHAWRTVPFHRERLAPLKGLKRGNLTMEAWRRIPLLTRDDIQDAGPALLSRSVPNDHRPTYDIRTSGSTGKPVEIKGTVVTNLFFRALNLRYHVWHGRNFSATTGSITRARPGSGSDKPRNWVPSHRSGPLYLFDVIRPTEEQFAWLETKKADYLLTYPSNLVQLLKHSAATGKKPPGLIEVATMGEVLDPEVRAECKRVWGMDIVDAYSAEEVGMIALQCPEHPHYHVQSESLLIEILDDAGEPCAPGRIGRVVITDLHNFATPLIRYEMGDFAEVGGACSCGRGLPVITRILGRSRNVLLLPTGGHMWPVFSKILAAAVPEMRQAQLVQLHRDEVVARIVVSAPLTAVTEERALKALDDALGNAFTVRLEYVDEIERSPAGKFEEVKCEIEA